VSESALVPGTFNVVHKRDAGGSITAIKSAQGTLTSFNDTSGNPGGLAAISASCGVVSSGISKCTTVSAITLSVHAANANFSDVDAAQFQSPLNGGVKGAGKVASSAVATQVFGFAVNSKLRNAMQVAMLDSGVLPNTCSVGDETEACMPNLTSAQLTSIFGKNRLTDWSNIRFGGAASQNLLEAQSPGDRPANRDIHICSRTAGSGTLATANIKFENAPCFAGNEAIQAATAQTITPETGTPGSEKPYHSMSSSGDLENCLTGLNSGTEDGNFKGANVPTSFRWAIGIMGTERNANNSLAYRFIKIDGASPSAKNVVNGKYKFWGELALVGTTTTDTLTADLIANVKRATLIPSVNVTNNNFGITGYLGTPNNAEFLPTYAGTGNGGTAGLINAAYDSIRPVNPYTHEVANGGSLNHCRTPAIRGGKDKAIQAFN